MSEADITNLLNVILVFWTGLNTLGLFFMFIWIKDHKEIEHKETESDWRKLI